MASATDFSRRASAWLWVGVGWGDSSRGGPSNSDSSGMSGASGSGYSASSFSFSLAQPSPVRTQRRLKECPGRDCPGYKIIFGTDYVVTEQEAQGRMLRDAIIDHLRVFPEAVVVIEEYDKMGCPARGMLKQLLDKGAAANATFHRAVFVLESNVGFVQIHSHLRELSAASESKECRANGDGVASATCSAETHRGGGGNGGEGRGGGEGEATYDQGREGGAQEARANEGDKGGVRRGGAGEVDVTAMQRLLRDLVFKRWSDKQCEDRSDTHKAVGAVDLFVPFVPLDRAAVGDVIKSHLGERAALKVASGELRGLSWGTEVIDFLVGQVEFERDYSIEGGKEASAVLSRWVTRAVRRLTEIEAEAARESRRKSRATATAGGPESSRGPLSGLGPPLQNVHVVIALAEEGNELVARVVSPQSAP